MNKNYLKISIYLGVLLLALFLLGFFITKPLLIEIQEKSLNLERQQLFIKNADKNQDNFQILNKKYLDQESIINKAEASLLDKDQAINFIKKIEYYADLTNNSHDIIFLPPVKKKKNSKNKTEIKELPGLDFQVNLLGSFSNLINFTKYLETGNYFVFIKSLDLNRAKNKDGEFTDQISLSIKLRVFTR
ncbi:hypothetical protein CL633_01210 [bacterium]|nr:hypothetical protein [bacterium]|tara:strand:+ start:472 stop:1038 length:567 start_codon:yes stop_codon:yes gene_type:complete